MLVFVVLEQSKKLPVEIVKFLLEYGLHTTYFVAFIKRPKLVFIKHPKLVL